MDREPPVGEPTVAVGEPTPGRRRSRVAFGVLFALAAALALAVVWPFRGPLFLAIVVATLLHDAYQWLTRRLRGRGALAAGIIVLAVAVLIFGPLAAAATFTITQLVHGFGFVRDQLLQPGRIDRTLRAVHLSRERLGELAGRGGAAVEHAAQEALRSSWRLAFHTGIFLIALFFLLREGAALVRWLRRIAPLEAEKTNTLLGEFKSVSRASILGAGLTALVQAMLATVGYFIVRLPHPLFFGLLTLLASFIPAIGSLLVYVPAALILWATGHPVAAVVLLCWCLLLVNAAEHIAKPLFLRWAMRGQGEMHGGLVFLSLLGGIEMFGLIGIVFGPVAMAFFLAMLRLHEQDQRPPVETVH